MFDKPSALHSFGLDIEGTTIKAVQLSFSKGKPVLDQTFDIVIDSQPGEDVNPLYMSDEGQHLINAINKHLVATCLESHDVLVRPLEIKLKKKSDIASVLAFQAEPLLPYPIENAILDYIPLGKTPEGTQINVIAARKDHIQNHLNIWIQNQIEPEIISCVPAALALFSKHFSPMNDPHFVVQIDQTHTTCVLVKGGMLLAAQANHTGLNAFKQVMEKVSLESLDFSNLHSNEHPELFELWENWRLEITRILFALARQQKEQEVKGILFAGDISELHNLDTAFCQTINQPLLQPVLNPQFPITTAQLQRFAIPIGAAISALPKQEQINFRQQELIYPRPWKHLTKPVTIYFALCVGLAFSFFLFGEAYLSYQEDSLKEKYVELLGSMNKTYNNFEKEYTSKFPSLTVSEGGISPAKELTQENLTSRLQYLQKEIKDSPDLFPMMPNTPRVSDTLAWFSSHPMVINKEKDSSENPPSQLIIDNFSYTMVKRPEPKKAQEKYQVKVELEFSSPTPKLAREFHDSLIAPNDIVDPKGEIKWSSNKGKYRTSFFLKDKTAYTSVIKIGD